MPPIPIDDVGHQPVEGKRYLIADVDCIPGFTGAVFLGREPEGGADRFALENSQKVICVNTSRLYLSPMTESDWLTSTDADTMLAFLGRSATQSRRHRLFGAACCRLIEERLTPEILAAVERFEESNRAEVLVEVRTAMPYVALLDHTVSTGIELGMLNWARNCARAARTCLGPDDRHQLSDFLRDLCGPQLFRPIAFDPSWRTVTVDAIARGMYDWRDFSHMRVLADALEDAGCSNADVLNHCRSAGPHVRGCWVVDLILGKGTEANDTIFRWLRENYDEVSTGPLIYYKTPNMAGQPRYTRVVDRSESPQPRTIGDMLALPTGRRFGESLRDCLIAEFWEEGLLCVNQSASVRSPEDWIAVTGSDRLSFRGHGTEAAQTDR